MPKWHILEYFEKSSGDLFGAPLTLYIFKLDFYGKQIICKEQMCSLFCDTVSNILFDLLLCKKGLFLTEVQPPTNPQIRRPNYYFLIH